MSDYSELVAYWREEAKYTFAHGGNDDATKYYIAMCTETANAIEALMRKVEVARGFFDYIAKEIDGADCADTALEVGRIIALSALQKMGE